MIAMAYPMKIPVRSPEASVNHFTIGVYMPSSVR